MQGGQTLDYVYDASGQKLSVSVGGVTTYYQGGFEYDGSMSLVRLSTGEGQLVKQNNAWQWQYYLSDQQGNVRVVVQEGGNTLHENQYYPFGLSYAPSVGMGVQQGNRYQFLGKETQPQTGYVDLQARQYDPQLGRFVTVDPVTEGQEALSPYQYGWNSPSNKSDPTGRYPGEGIFKAIKKWFDEPISRENQATGRAAAIISLGVDVKPETRGEYILFMSAHAASSFSQSLPGQLKIPLSSRSQASAGKVGSAAPIHPSQVNIRARSNNIQDSQLNSKARNLSTTGVGDVWCAPYLGPLVKLDNGLNLDPYERQDQTQVHRRI